MPDVDRQLTYTDPNCFQVCCGYVGCDCGQGLDDDLAKIRSNDKRSCTDLVACFLFLCVLILQVAMTAQLADKGSNPDFIAGGYDFNGVYCDESAPLVFWPDVEQWKFRVCTDSCAKTQDSSIVVTPSGNPGYKSTKWFDTWCIPDSNEIRELVGGNMEGFNVAMGDIYTARYALIGSLFMAIFLTAVYLCVLYYCGTCIIWVLLVLTTIATAVLAALVWTKGEQMADEGFEDTAKAAKAFAVILIVVDVLFALTMCCMRDRINVSMRLIMQAASAFKRLACEFVLVPILHFILLMGYLAIWITMMIYVVSTTTESREPIPDSLAGNPLYSTADGKYVDLDWDQKATENIMWIHIFGLFWAVEFIGYWMYMVMSGAFAEWYFTPWNDDARTSKTVSGNLILRSLWRVTRFHLGTVAFGSLIIAVIKTIRAALAYIEAQTKEAENPLTKCLSYMVHCLLGCLECCIDKINKDGFIFTSIYGSPYCASCFAAVDVLMKHVDYAVIIETLSTIVIKVAKFLTAISTAAIMILICQQVYEDHELNTYVVVGVIFFLAGYLVAIIIFGVFDTAIESVFICFLTDLSVNGEKHLQYASGDIAQVFGEYRDRHKQDKEGNATTAV